MNRHDTAPPAAPVNPSIYDPAYFLGECEGYEEYKAAKGRTLSRRLQTALEHADVHPHMRVLDVGCGRGESMIWLARRGARAYGLDYAEAALRIARDTVTANDGESGDRSVLVHATARCLPFRSGSFDRVLMLDIVEHLCPWELDQALREAWRVLRDGGNLFVHTAPNVWYYRFGYPLYRLVLRVQGTCLPADPRERFRYHRLVHVNEQSPKTLSHSLRAAGFETRVWVENLSWRWGRQGKLTRTLAWAATRAPIVRYAFCGDILAVGTKLNPARCSSGKGPTG